MRLCFTYDIYRITDFSFISKFILKPIREELLEQEENHDRTLEAAFDRRMRTQRTLFWKLIFWSLEQIREMEEDCSVLSVNGNLYMYMYLFMQSRLSNI